MPGALSSDAPDDLVALHKAVLDLAGWLRVLYEEIPSALPSGWAAEGRFARGLLGLQVDLFALAERLDDRLAAGGAIADGAGGWTVPADSDLAALAAARNLVVPFQVIVLPQLFTATTVADARAVFTTGPGCDLAAALSTAIDTLAGGGS